MSVEQIRRNIEKILQTLEGSGTELIAATKTRTAEEINFAIACGVRHIGENRVQELVQKYDQLNLEGVTVHLIGQLQTNKVKYIVDKVDLIHSVDSLRLAQEIDRRAKAAGKVQDILIEVNIGREESKGGVPEEELLPLLKEIALLPAVRVRGLMCIPPVAENDSNLKYFLKLRQLSVDIRAKKLDNIHMDILSMGMSDDYADAVRAGSSFVRIGRGIFGPRTIQPEVKVNG